MNTIKILAIGDVAGPLALERLAKILWGVRKQYGIDLVIANGENSAEPNGIDSSSGKALFDCGVDVITTGNHVYRKSSAHRFLDDNEYVLRPLNFPSANPGHGDCIIKVKGYRVLVMNVLGQVYMESVSCPFEAIEKCLERNKDKYDVGVLDVHAEATGEKKTIAYSFADRLSVCFGTHTHVQTNDPQILLDRCGYLSDVGMCGAEESILGVKKEAIISKIRYKLPSKFDFAQGKIACDMAIFEINTDTGCCVSVKNIRIGE